MTKTLRIQNQLKVCLTGELDHHTALAVRKDVDKLLEDPAIDRLIFDFGNVSFMDSSALGMMIGRYKIMKARGGQMRATGLSEFVKRIYTIGGLHRIIPIDDIGGEDGK